MRVFSPKSGRRKAHRVGILSLIFFNMKKIFFILSFLLCIGAKNYAQNVNIPDANFKAALVGNAAINTNGDSEIQVSEASAFTGTINVDALGISDLTGIETFTAITSLKCSGNQLTSLDMSNNTDLINLYCFQNQLTFLDVSNNTNLTILWCESNQLTSLDISNNIALSDLRCGQNQLSSLDVSNCVALQILTCFQNQLPSLDILNCVALQNLYCFNNQLTFLDVSNNTNLTILVCENNPLTSLDLSNNTNLIVLSCRNNQLTSLDLSNNTVLQDLLCVQNPNLYCIQVWDTTYANTNWTATNGRLDPQMFFSLDCSNVSTAENLASSLSILPNPASDYLYISYEGEKKLSFAISDIWGKTLAAWETTSAGAFYQKEVSLADFPVGIYFLSAQAGDKKVVKKFVKE